ncbi:type I DNA topoisomerase [Thermodesulfobacteriota bacterium]
MPKNVVIVESPTKARTLKKYLGKDFDIVASVGHIKDLPSSRLGVDIQKDFEPEYVTIKGKDRVIKELKKAVKGAEVIYLGPDPDREGEAIAWHIFRELNGGNKKVYRVLFNEFTARAIKAALASPQSLNRNRYESQQARRVLDRLVGYQISPLLWTRVRRGLSAGRVQSVALRMICDREKEIYAFEPQEYWSLTAHLETDEQPFTARLIKYDGQRADLKSEAQTLAAVAEVESGPFSVEKVTKKKKKRNPSPPFTTSLLQQDAYKKLNFRAKKTMFLAQNLYEGIELGDRGLVGLITYMRTDSFRLSQEAVAEAREFILGKFGPDYLPEKPNSFRSRKGAQEAHEAIRPTDVTIQPDDLARYLSKDQFALYRLIWKRFVACQMKPAIMDQTQADIASGKGLFRASGSVVVFKGFTTLYEETLEGATGAKNKEGLLPPIKKGQNLTLIKLDPAQHFTQPPPRFSEATLIKEMEENGIGRPSTYASILANIHGREYATIEKGRFRPTELGFLVAYLLVKSFPAILDVAFTAQMEGNLDKIERGKIGWTKVLDKFYSSFHQDLEKAQKEMGGSLITDIACPECRKPLNIKSGKNGIFLGCSGYPECKYTANFYRDESGKVVIEKKDSDDGKVVGECEQCNKPMVVKNGRYGPFLACSGYPECKNTRPLEKNGDSASTNVPCPEKDCQGVLVQRRSKRGKTFYACNQYPRCRFALWDKPAEGACPLCGTPVLAVREPKGSEPVLVCRKKGCGYREPITPEGQLPTEGTAEADGS